MKILVPLPPLSIDIIKTWLTETSRDCLFNLKLVCKLSILENGKKLRPNFGINLTRQGLLSISPGVTDLSNIIYVYTCYIVDIDMQIAYSC